jgi:pyruvate dehydrogenase E2 component (dihydrolipoamide acetyltransferase)
MATEFKLPELGENITAGDVVRVLVAAGDTVAKDQPILELETDKATIEVPSSVSGTVKDVRVKQGERVKVGQVVLTVDDGGAKAEAKPASDGAKAEAKAEAPKSESKPQPVGAPEEGGLSQAEPGKAAGSPEAPAEDAAQPRQKPRGEVVEISRGARAAASAAPPPPQPEAEAEGPMPPAAPSVRRLARDPPRHPDRPWRTHQRRRRAGVRARGDGRWWCRTRRCTWRSAASRLQQVGRSRAQADEQHPAQDVGASQSRVGDHPARDAA